jgi:hypothetical protein
MSDRPPTTSPASSWPAGFDNEEEDGPKPVWWRRRSFIVGVVVAVVLLATVLTDLPQNATPSVQYGTDVQVLSQVNMNVVGCSYAVGEAFMIRRRELAGTLTPGDKAQVPRLLQDDQNACSFTSQNIFDLSNVEAPGSSSGRYMQNIVSVVTTWATSDCLLAIEQIQTLWSHPRDQRAIARLATAQKRMSEDRAKAEADMAAADRIVERRLPRLKLTSVPA